MRQLYILLLTVTSLSMILGGCKKSDVKTLPVLTTTSASNITSTSASAGGSITSNGGSQISQIGICYAMHNPPTLSDSLVLSGANGTGGFSVNLTSLIPNTTYYIRAYAINQQGTALGNVDSFTTSAGLATVTTAAVSNNQALSATSGWNLVNNGGSSITAIGICWSTSPNPTISDSKTSDTITAKSASDTLKNLNLTTYYVRSYATNSAGTAYGNEIVFTVSSNETVVDIDGNAYPVVTIGGRIWMAANLRVTHYQNGDSILNGFAETGFNWATPPGGAYTFPNGDTANKRSYGLLYNLTAVLDNRNIAPAGWHVATDAEWEALEFAEGMAASDTGKIGVRGTIGPLLQVGGASGLNLSLPGNFSNNTFVNFGLRGFYHSTTPANSMLYFYREVFVSTNVNYPTVLRNYTNSVVMAVRCVKN